VVSGGVTRRGVFWRYIWNSIAFPAMASGIVAAE